MQYHSVSDGYFETMGATLIEGRAFTAARHAGRRGGRRSSTRRWPAGTIPDARPSAGRSSRRRRRSARSARNLTWTFNAGREPDAAGADAHRRRRRRHPERAARHPGRARGLRADAAVPVRQRHDRRGRPRSRDGRAGGPQRAEGRVAADAPRHGRDLGRSAGEPHRGAAPADDHADVPSARSPRSWPRSASTACSRGRWRCGAASWRSGSRSASGRGPSARPSCGAAPSWSPSGWSLGVALVQAARGLLSTVLFGVTPHDTDVDRSPAPRCCSSQRSSPACRRRGGRCGSTRSRACARSDARHRRRDYGFFTVG